MCWLVMVGVRRLDGDAAAVFRGRGYVAEPATSPQRVLLGEDAVALSVGDGHCSCEIFLRDPGHVPVDAERRRARYRRKGWSQSRIERALQARLESDAGKAQRRVPRSNRFPAAIAALVEAGAEVSLLAHFFEASFDAPFEIAGREQLALEQFTRRDGAFPADTVVTIHA